MSAVQNATDDDHVMVRSRAWMVEANCRGRDLDLFFPAYGSGGYAGRQARRICRECPVQQACGEYAEANGERFGIWAGRNRRSK